MGYLYSLSKFQPNVAIKWGQTDEVGQYSAGVSWQEPMGFYLTRRRSPSVCAKCVPARQNSAKFVNAQQEQES